MQNLFRPFRALLKPGSGYAALLGGMGAFGLAELAGRVVRLMLTVVIARRLAPGIIGDAALTLTVFELVKVLERTGTGPRIVAADAHELDVTCNTANFVYGWWTAALTLAQVGLGIALWQIWGKGVAGAMLVALAGVYPLMALGHVSYFLALRAGRNAQLAKVSAIQSIADQLMTAGLLIAWPSPWAIVLPKLLTAPLWLAMVRRIAPWQRVAALGRLPLHRVVRFSAAILAGEVLQVLRTQGDNLIIVSLLGTEALGLYYFAFNSGLGIMSAAVSALATVAFPQLCKAALGAARAATLRRVVVLALAIVPLAIVQSLVAPWYVPLLFGARWAVAVPLVSTLCLAAIALAATTVATCWLRAEQRPGRDALATGLVCAAALGGLLLGAASGNLLQAARGLVIGQSVAAALVVLLLLVPAAAPRDARLAGVAA